MESRAGYWTDAFPMGDSIGWVRVVGPNVILAVDTVDTMTLTPPSVPRYIKGASDGRGGMCLAGQAQEGGLVYYQDAKWHWGGIECGTAPGVWWSGSEFVIYAPKDNGVEYVKVIGGVASAAILNEVGLTSEGINQIATDGTPIWAMTTHVRTIRGTTMTVTCEANGVVVGQLGGIVGGIGVETGDPFMALNAGGMSPRVAFAGGKWACASWTSSNLSCYNVFPPEEALPVAPPTEIPTFAFTHPATVAIFKDPNGDTPAPLEVVVNSTGQRAHRDYFAAGDSLPGTAGLVGIYSQAADIPSDLALATAHATRLAVCYDGPGSFVIPSNLRAYDQLWLELYPVVGEPIDASRARWHTNLIDLLARWPGDIGVVPAFYCQGGAPSDETWPVEYILDCLASLSGLVNISPRVKTIAPFAYERANGITAHKELQETLLNLLDAATQAGLASFLPVSHPNPDPQPPNPTPEDPTPMPNQLAFALTPLHTFSEPLTFDQVVDVETHSDGDGLSALKYPDGYASWSGSGWDPHKASAGAWERFKVGSGTMTAYRDGVVTVFACVPVVVKS